MKLKTLTSLLPVAFALHNLEEGLTMPNYLQKAPDMVPIALTGEQFWFALTLFTVLGCVVGYCKCLFKNLNQHIAFLVAFAGILFLNVFFPHVLVSLLSGKYTPGLITALTINLPLSYVIFQKILRAGIFPAMVLFRYVGAGAVAGLALLCLFLTLAQLLIR